MVAEFNCAPVESTMSVAEHRVGQSPIGLMLKAFWPAQRTSSTSSVID